MHGYLPPQSLWKYTHSNGYNSQSLQVLSDFYSWKERLLPEDSLGEPAPPGSRGGPAKPGNFSGGADLEASATQAVANSQQDREWTVQHVSVSVNALEKERFCKLYGYW